MTIEAVANRLVELCRAEKYEQAYEELFAEDAKGYEMEGLPDRIVEGKTNLLAKSKAHIANWKIMHSNEVTDPLVYAGFFSIGMRIDVTNTEGNRHAAEELCVYEVKDGKIVAERFFYAMV